MSVAARIDTREVARLSDELRRVPARLGTEVYAVVKKGAQNVKTDAAERASGHAHLPHYPRSISYAMSATSALRGRIAAEVGPDRRAGLQGNLGPIVEYGTSTSAPMPHLAPALEAEAPAFERALAAVAADVLPGG